MAFDPSKLDKTLGNQIHEHLKTLGIETPTTDLLLLDDEQKIQTIMPHVQAILETLGLDLTDDSLQDTPKRVAKMWVREKFWGLCPGKFPKMMTIENKMKYQQMVCEKNIRVLSDCEHHLAQIDGFAHVAYISNGKILGLSKLNRIVQYFSARPQVQERIGEQIGEALKFILGTEDVAVCIEASHYCVIARGARDYESSTTTSFLSGVFRDDPMVRSEFYSMVNGK